jgi:hypothetical protein
MATRMQQRRGTASQWTTANPVLAAGEIGFETDTSKFKIGDGSSAWTALPYFTNLDAIVAGAPGALDTLNELAAALGDNENFATTVTNSLAAKAGLLSKTDSEWTAYTTDIPVGTVAYNSTNDQIKIGMGDKNWSELSHLITSEALSIAISDVSTGILADSEFTGNIVLPSTTSIGSVTGTEISYLDGVTSAIQTQLNDIESDATYAYNTVTTHETSKADVASPTFSGNVVLPTTTNIGDVSAAEILALNGVTGSIQTQLDAKLASATAATTYAPINNASLTGNVSLPSTTTIGNVSATEIAYLDGVTSAVQTQLDAKAPIANPTFTGTVSGVTKTHVGLGNVDNTSDADKPISSATQTALDAKASLSGATFTGDVTVETDLIVDGNLTVTGTTTTVSAQDLVVSDPLIYIGEGNTGNLVDIGIVGNFNDGTYQHSGIVRDASAGKWKLFKGVTDEPTTTVNFGQGSLDDIAVNNVEVSGVVFSDGSQTKQGVPSLTPIIAKTASYTLGALTERDSLIEVSSSSATTVTIPADGTLNFPVGTSLDILQTGSGQVTIAGAGGVTVNATPGLKLRTQWSSATLFKRAANTWVVYGDLTA